MAQRTGFSKQNKSRYYATQLNGSVKTRLSNLCAKNIITRYHYSFKVYLPHAYYI